MPILISSNPEATDSLVNRDIEKLFKSTVYSKVIDNILFYISDCITCNLIASIDFQDYVTSVLQPAVLTDQQFFATLYATFLNLKNRDKISRGVL